ncbi:A kinase (PRKA) anchor protein 1b [Notolabrus celidotus]|uniref:A kinase (PRKA) anchor protein 1b n=1 Tax=Notolabrus celidotus TaxID=1203425 RepID=UPI0014904970|nr:A kinase (PRKA) anchor protein 1b [Notolabrus celidotus]XP_034534881.1 A kinase (PRKA) anchor protein 1b [Notolabrus celidotus]
MPLRFRSVVPYTLPGVLALIGWWWYVSRKKDRLVCHDGPEGAPTGIGARSSPTEGSNGLVEKGADGASTDTVSSAHRPAQDGTQRTQCSEETHRSEAAAPQLGHILLLSSQTSAGEEDHILQGSPRDHKDLKRSSLTEHETHRVQDLTLTPAEDVVLACQSTKVSHSCPLSDAERPEPEGEVAKHHGSAVTQEEMLVCTVTPAKVQRATPSEADSLETPPLAQDFNPHILTSTPNFPFLSLASTALTPVQDSCAPSSETTEDVQVHAEELDLELLAAGLITEVISAATQEVLGITSSQGTGSGRLCSPQEPITAEHLHPLSGPPQSEKQEQGMSNGCSPAAVWEPVEVRGHQKHSAQRELWHQPAQSSSLLHMKLRGDELLAEDSACSTCHSEDGVSSEDLLNSVFDNHTDVLQVTDLSTREDAQPPSQAESNAEETVVPEGEEISKRLNGMGLRNGAHGTSEVETDQSGGSDVNSMDSVDSGCTMGVSDSQSNHAASSSSELVIWEIEVPKHLVGRLIGKQGRYVSFLKQNSGAKIYISTLPYTQEFQICHIEGTQQQVDKALSLIGKKFKDLDLTNLYAPPPPPLTLPSLPMTSWLLLPSGVTVEVIVVNIVSAGHVFVQQHTHPTYHALRSLDQQMFLCYSQPGTPALPSPAEVGVICAAPAVEGAWWRAQVITFYKETNEVEIRYVDYGGYDRVKIDSLRQIRSDFVTLPFQGAEVLLDNIAPLPGEDRFSADATTALEEMTRGVALLAQVSNYDNNTGLPLVHLWNMVGDEVVSVNRTLAERGLGVWVDGF